MEKKIIAPNQETIIDSLLNLKKNIPDVYCLHICQCFLWRDAFNYLLHLHYCFYCDFERVFLWRGWVSLIMMYILFSLTNTSYISKCRSLKPWTSSLHNSLHNLVDFPTTTLPQGTNMWSLSSFLYLEFQESHGQFPPTSFQKFSNMVSQTHTLQ